MGLKATLKIFMLVSIFAKSPKPYKLLRCYSCRETFLSGPIWSQVEARISLVWTEEWSLAQILPPTDNEITFRSDWHYSSSKTALAIFLFCNRQHTIPLRACQARELSPIVCSSLPLTKLRSCKNAAWYDFSLYFSYYNITDQLRSSRRCCYYLDLLGEISSPPSILRYECWLRKTTSALSPHVCNLGS